MNKKMKSSRVGRNILVLLAVVAVCLLALSSELSAVEAASFKGLGFLGTYRGDRHSIAYGVSGDGLVVVGSSSASGYDQQAFRWTEQEGMIGLGDLPGGGASSYARAASADGLVIVGGSSAEFPEGGTNVQAFRWTALEGMVGLGDLPGGGVGSVANGVSGDGSVVVGLGYPSSKKQAFRWTEGSGMEGLGSLAGPAHRSEAYGVSADGNVIVGASNSPLAGTGYYDREGFIWSPWSGMKGLGSISTARYKSRAYGVSADGTVVVGRSSGLAFRWTAESGIESLGDLPDGNSIGWAWAASGDGSVIVGSGAFVWHKEQGAQRLETILEAYGVDLTGWILVAARGLSYDGRTIVGYGINPAGQTEAWIATIPSVGNTVPIACIVGGDKAIEVGSSCEARVILDGSCSSDVDSTEGTNDDINDFGWYEVIDACEPNSDIYIGSGEVIECNLGLGEHVIILEVTDKAGAFDTNEVMITVEDVTPPEFSLIVEPNVLWPPNNKVVLVTPGWEVSDNCDEEVEVSLVDITMSAEGDVNDYVQIDDDGSIYLRATKGQGRAARIYTLTYEAVDGSGNVAVDSAEVVVPHDLGRR